MVSCILLLAVWMEQNLLSSHHRHFCCLVCNCQTRMSPKGVILLNQQNKLIMTFSWCEFLIIFCLGFIRLITIPTLIKSYKYRTWSQVCNIVKKQISIVISFFNPIIQITSIFTCLCHQLPLIVYNLMRIKKHVWSY